MKRLMIVITAMIAAVGMSALEKYVDIDMIRTPSSPRMLVEGFLFTLPAETGYEISLRSNADNWQRDYPFRQNMYNVWCLYLPYSDLAGLGGGSLLYKLNINGYWDNDPSNDNYIFDKFHDRLSYLRIPEERDNCRKKMPIISDGENKFQKKVTFKYYNPDVSEVSVVCSNTNWAIFSYNMALDKFGYWSADLTLGKGEFYYYFIADWEKVLDDQNPDSVYDSEIGEVNVIRID